MALIFAVGFGAGLMGSRGTALGQRTPPTDDKGRTAKTLASIDLGPEMEGFQGYHLRIRSVSWEPGGYGKLHSHKGRPVVWYGLQGTLTDCRTDGNCTDIREGQGVAEGKDVTHWTENRGTKPLTLLACDISKEP